MTINVATTIISAFGEAKRRTSLLPVNLQFWLQTTVSLYAPRPIHYYDFVLLALAGVKL